jgi:hypothetical protein
MKNTIFLSVLSAVCLAAAGAFAQTPASPTLSVHPKPTQKYTCLMHPEVATDQPGDCPKCGMKLVPVEGSKHPPSEAARERPASEVQHATSHRSGDIVAHEQHRLRGSDHGQDDRAGGEMQMQMSSSVNIAEPMSRESSGTSWVPDSTPTYGRMFMLGDDMLMLHGAIWPRYVNASTRRGDDRIDAPNWFMAMYSHPFNADAQLGLRGMVSLDPLTEGGRGYPLLFQSGETWQGAALHDRQHPHDLVDELSITYSQRFTRDLSAFLYFGYPGEPALGPPTFMHRLSAMDNPDAPISHHWQDSTHVTFGVVTIGAVWRAVKLEGSVFTGREPNENRYDFDEPRFDSYSGRLSWNPTDNLSLQVSHGFIKSPEPSEPDADRHRTTASAVYNQPLGHDSNWSTSLVWGRNNDTHEGTTDSWLLETNFQRGRHTVYGRWEHVEKSGHELVLNAADEKRIFPIQAYTVGYVRDLSHGQGIDIGVGGQFTINTRPDALERYYGDELPYSFEMFFRIRPSTMMRHSANQSAATK